MGTLSDQSTRDAHRAAFLRQLYADTGGNTLTGRTNFRAVGEKLGFDEQESTSIATWLRDRDLGRFVALGGSYGITPRGVDEVERLNREREQSHAAQLVVLTQVERQNVERALRELELADVESRLAGDDLAEYLADRDTVLAQLRSPRSKKEIVSHALRRLGVFAAQFGAGVAAGLIANALS